MVVVVANTRRGCGSCVSAWKPPKNEITTKRCQSMRDIAAVAHKGKKFHLRHSAKRSRSVGVVQRSLWLVVVVVFVPSTSGWWTFWTRNGSLAPRLVQSAFSTITVSLFFFLRRDKYWSLGYSSSRSFEWQKNCGKITMLI
jgi:hypothetical protein